MRVSETISLDLNEADYHTVVLETTMLTSTMIG